jgi:hypothetical protein
MINKEKIHIKKHYKYENNGEFTCCDCGFICCCRNGVYKCITCDKEFCGYIDCIDECNKCEENVCNDCTSEHNSVCG